MSRSLRIFLTFWLLIAGLAAFNFYNYRLRHVKLSLVVAIICGVIWLAWAFFYFFYVRKSK
jgi:hypothetical protein